MGLKITFFGQIEKQFMESQHIKGRNASLILKEKKRPKLVSKNHILFLTIFEPVNYNITITKQNETRYTK